MRGRSSFAGVLIALLMILCAAALAGTPGSFRGTVVETDQQTIPGWIYVQGRNGAIRRVEISRARVDYDDSVPAASRNRKPQEALVAGTEVRITAEQGGDGEWRATIVEILNAVAPTRAPESRGKS